MPLHIIFSTKRFVANRTEPTHVNSTGAECRLRKGRMFCIYIGLASHDIPLLTPPPQFYCFPPPPPHFYCFHSSFRKLPQLVYFVAMSQVVKNNRGFLQRLAILQLISASFSTDSHSATTICISPSLIQCIRNTF